jgi:hypothetical protein
MGGMSPKVGQDAGVGVVGAVVGVVGVVTGMLGVFGNGRRRLFEKVFNRRHTKTYLKNSTIL